MSVARYELRGPNRLVSERPTILEMLALRRAAQRVVELTEMLLLSLIAGRRRAHRPAQVRASRWSARRSKRRATSSSRSSRRCRACCPTRSSSASTIVKAEPKRAGRTLID